MKQYRFGVSWGALLAFLLVMAPNVLWMLWPPTNDLLAQNSAPPLIEAVMGVSQWAMVALLALVQRRDEARPKREGRRFAAACGALLLAYYGLWTAYYLGYAAPLIFLGMAVFPCAYFILFALWRRNFPALAPAAVFAVVHIGVTAWNFLL